MSNVWISYHQSTDLRPGGTHSIPLSMDVTIMYSFLFSRGKVKAQSNGGVNEIRKKKAVKKDITDMASNQTPSNPVFPLVIAS